MALSNSFHFFIFTLLCGHAVSLLKFESGQEVDLKRQAEFDDYVIDNYVISASTMSGSLVQCSGRCANDLQCVSLFHHRQNGSCQLHGGRFYVPVGGRREKGWRYRLLSRGKTCPVEHGYILRRDLDLCYRLEFTTLVGSDAAVRACAAEGGHLLVVDTMEKFEHIRHQIFSSDVTRLSDPNGSKGYLVDGVLLEGDNWVWPSSGRTFVTSDIPFWGAGEPQSTKPERKNLFLKVAANFSLAKAFGGFPHTFACEIDI